MKTNTKGFLSGSNKTEALTRFALIGGVLIMLNIVSGFLFTRLDLTEDKRYTLTNESKELIRSLDDVVSIEVFLDGDLPALFKRLRNSTQELLENFRGYNGLVEFRFVNPLDGKPEQVKDQQKFLQEKGILPVNLSIGGTGESKRQLIYPYALVTYRTNKPFRVNLLENQVAGQSQEEIINNSINLLEYKFSNAIHKQLVQRRPVVAFLRGHGELDSIRTVDLKRSLNEFYTTGDLDLDLSPSINRIYVSQDSLGREVRDTFKVDVLVVAKPMQAIPEQHKFKIDQYIMSGGTVIWLLDVLRVDMDSVATRPAFVPQDNPLNLDDMLFRYGVRLNPNVVADGQSCSKIPVVVGQQGGKPQLELKPWWYYPVGFSPDGNHPIVRGMDGVDMRFPSMIDTAVRTKSPVKKTVLLASSSLSRLQMNPVRISLDELDVPLIPERFGKSSLPMAVLLEGVFNSPYDRRVSPEMAEGLTKIGLPFQAQSVPTKMIVVSDGDVAASDIDRRDGTPMPLGYNRFENYTFGNKDFMVNCIEYLTDSRGIVAARTKEFKLRLLNKKAVNDDRVFWQVVNLAGPLLFLAVFGLVFRYLRKKRYA